MYINIIIKNISCLFWNLIFDYRHIFDLWKSFGTINPTYRKAVALTIELRNERTDFFLGQNSFISYNVLKALVCWLRA